MPTVKCRNTRNEKGNIVKCDRFLIQLPQCVIDSLKSNPENRIVLRCPTCPSVVRWTAIYYNNDSKFVWETIKNPRNFETEFQFDHVVNCEEVNV
jgi:hypothetical protein